MNRRFIILFLVILNCNAFSQGLVISEIFADPSPSHGLPEAEFLELYNGNEFPIALKNYKLLIGNSLQTFSVNDSIAPKNYVIVCKKSDIGLFEKYGQTIGVSSMVLPNNGTSLKIIDANQKVIFSVEYQMNWYSKNKNQGYSLEMIDLNYACVGKNNWTSSIAAIGGTPAMKNSVQAINPDLNPPLLLKTDLASPTQIVLYFDENVEVNILDFNNYFFVNKLNYHFLKADYVANAKDIVQLSLNAGIEEGDSIELNIQNIEDCSGNRVIPMAMNIYNLEKAKKGTVILSEILFNPLNTQDYVEIYNNGSQKVNIKNWKMARINNLNKISDFNVISSTDLILNPFQYLAISTDTNAITQNYFPPTYKKLYEVINLPTYNNDQGTVILTNEIEEIQDSLSYSEKMQNKNLTNFNGVALERLSFSRVNHDFNTWLSASSLTHFGTPGYENSQMLTNNVNNDIYVSPIVFNPFQATDNGSTQIVINLPQSENFANISIFNKNGKMVRQLLNNQLIGTESKINWDGRDNYNSLLPVGYYIIKINVVDANRSQDYYLKTVIGSL